MTRMVQVAWRRTSPRPRRSRRSSRRPGSVGARDRRRPPSARDGGRAAEGARPRGVARGRAGRDRGADRAGRSRRGTPDFGRSRPRYDELRPVDDDWWELFEPLAERGPTSPGGACSTSAAAPAGSPRRSPSAARRRLGRRPVARDARGRARRGAAQRRPEGGARRGAAVQGRLVRAASSCGSSSTSSTAARAFAEARRVLGAGRPPRDRDLRPVATSTTSGSKSSSRRCGHRSRAVLDAPKLEAELLPAGLRRIEVLRLSQTRRSRARRVARADPREAHLDLPADLARGVRGRPRARRARAAGADRVRDEWLVVVARYGRARTACHRERLGTRAFVRGRRRARATGSASCEEQIAAAPRPRSLDVRPPYGDERLRGTAA